MPFTGHEAQMALCGLSLSMGLHVSSLGYDGKLPETRGGAFCFLRVPWLGVELGQTGSFVIDPPIDHHVLVGTVEIR